MSEVDPRHYSRFKVQPIEFILLNDLSYLEGNIVKYLCRHDAKGGATDLKKAMRYLQLLLANEYNVRTIVEYLPEPVESHDSAEKELQEDDLSEEASEEWRKGIEDAFAPLNRAWENQENA